MIDYYQRCLKVVEVIEEALLAADDAGDYDTAVDLTLEYVDACNELYEASKAEPVYNLQRREVYDATDL